MTDTPLPHINLGGTLYRLCPTIDDVSRIEKKLSSNLLTLARKLAEGGMSVEELATIVEHSIAAEARHLSVRELVLHSGITHVTHAVTALFVHLFHGTSHHDISAPMHKSELETMAKKFAD